MISNGGEFLVLPTTPSQLRLRCLRTQDFESPRISPPIHLPQLHTTYTLIIANTQKRTSIKMFQTIVCSSFTPETTQSFVALPVFPMPIQIFC